MTKERFRFNPFLRFFTLFVGVMAIAYAVYAILSFHPEGKLRLFLPYVVVVLAANSVFRNLFTLNSLVLTDDQVIFKKLALPAFRVDLANIIKIRFLDKRMRYLQLSYSQGDTVKNYTFNLGYPGVLDALSKMKKKNPAIEFVGDLGKDL